MPNENLQSQESSSQTLDADTAQQVVHELRQLNELSLQVTKFREVAPEDLEDILAWYHHPSVKEHFAAAPANVEELEKVFASPDIHPFVAENSFGEVVGVLTFRDNLSSGRRNGYLERVAVSPDIQGKGVGTQMLKSALEQAFSRNGLNYYKVTLGVVTNITGWERTRHVYEKLGFQEVGVWRSHVVISADQVPSLPEELESNQQVRQTQSGLELLNLRDAIWMDLTKAEWESHDNTTVG